jgi:hypothetical protein
MAILRHEVWEDYGDGGEVLPGVCLAGPDGDDFRRLLASTARLIHTFEAGSHHEAMTIYYSLMGWGAYETEHPWDRLPYPDEWRSRQVA